MDSLIRKRGGVKSSLTSIEKYVDSIKFIEDHDLTEIKRRLDKLEKCNMEFDKIHGEIIEQCQEEDIAKYEDEREEFETRTGVANSTLTKLLEAGASPSSHANTSASSLGNGSTIEKN